MRLYYARGACSLSPHIVLRETKTPFELVKTDLKSKTTQDGRDFRQINKAGYVPALQLDDGTVLTEGPAIVQYVADTAHGAHLAPPPGTIDRYRLQSWLNFISSELHKGFSLLFKNSMPEAAKTAARETLKSRIALLDERLASHKYLIGDDFTVADAYAFTVLRWATPNGIDLAAYPNVADYLARIADRPAVKEAMKAEGLS